MGAGRVGAVSSFSFYDKETVWLHLIGAEISLWGTEDFWSIHTFSTSLTMNPSAEVGNRGGTRMLCH